MRFLSLFLVLAATLPAASIALSPAALSGPAGQTVGWGYTMQGDPLYHMVITSVQSDFPDFPGGLGGDAPAVTDIASGYFLANSLAIAPGGDFTQAFGPGTGLASFLIRPDAPDFAQEFGNLYIYYDLYDGDPNNGGSQVFPLDDPLFVTAAAQVDVEPVPEPSTWLLCGVALAMSSRRHASRRQAP